MRKIIGQNLNVNILTIDTPPNLLMIANCNFFGNPDLAFQNEF
jgi:hypothetical protein